ncbi:NADH-quinone oxidoreductase subunit L [Limnobacter humi]|uniref:Probable inorganic carbon transporter subunit DabB n=1 Tax=Limnobacter humi TaxID=1778671 RepID=A0ABT1WIP7_9BURK|nr:NADH-quinone oxidoreductase subunit L [Limnobacter humi]MCQ8896602.1 NADH-quinone oxidoreductase subunit L [Limnobacter humi]
MAPVALQNITMITLTVLAWFLGMAPTLAMLAACGWMAGPARSPRQAWRCFSTLSTLGLACSLGGLMLPGGEVWWLFQRSAQQAWMAPLVQGLGTVIGVFSARYLQGEPGQRRYALALAGLLAAVQCLLLADHWLVLIGSWALVGVILRRLLCFYPERPFAQLAAHKKQIADRLADVCLIACAGLVWWSTGTLRLSGLDAYLLSHSPDAALVWATLLLAVAVVLRTALFPVHGWLIQVMEAPTPVSAMLHAGVVNLSGFVLIRLSTLLSSVPAAQTLLVFMGLLTAVLAGLVMLTRITIKVRLAWSTVAQMGFMVVECGLGLYSLAALHLIGHSLYKAHAFLSASSVVQSTRVQLLQGQQSIWRPSLVLAAPLALGLVACVQWWSAVWFAPVHWPWWWSGVLSLAWAPLLWLPRAVHEPLRSSLHGLLTGSVLVAVLTWIASLAHGLGFGTLDQPVQSLGPWVLLGMALLYILLLALQLGWSGMHVFRRWSYAGFYVDEYFTRLALRFWPTAWGSNAATRSK